MTESENTAAPESPSFFLLSLNALQVGSHLVGKCPFTQHWPIALWKLYGGGVAAGSPQCHPSPCPAYPGMTSLHFIQSQLRTWLPSAHSGPVTTTRECGKNWEKGHRCGMPLHPLEKLSPKRPHEALRPDMMQEGKQALLPPVTRALSEARPGTGNRDKEA